MKSTKLSLSGRYPLSLRLSTHKNKNLHREAAVEMERLEIGAIICLDADGKHTGILTSRDVQKIIAETPTAELESKKASLSFFHQKGDPFFRLHRPPKNNN